MAKLTAPRNSIATMKAGICNLFPIGRNGMHRYNNQDHSMLAAKAAVDAVAGNSTDKSALWLVNAEDDYHEQK